MYRSGLPLLAGFRAAWPSLVRAMLVALAVVSGLCASDAAMAQPGASPTAHLAGCVARQQPGDVPELLLASTSRFDCRRASADWGPGDYWVRYVLPQVPPAGVNPPESALRYFRFIPAWQNRLAVITRDADGRTATRWLGDKDISRYIGIGGAVVIPLSDDAAPVTTILVRIDGALNAWGLIDDPRLLDGAGVRGAELVAAAIFAAFAGLGIGLFCYNLVLWLTTRERFQLTYCLSLLAMLAYVWVSSGAMAQQYGAIHHSTRLGITYVLLGFAAALALQFITDFIEPGKIPQRLRRFARQYGLVCVAAGIAVALASPAWRYSFDRVYVASFLPIPLLVVAIAALAWRGGSRSVRVLAIAWVVPLAMALVRIAHALHLIPYSPLVQYALVVGMGVQALLSSLAMSFRIKRITDERDRARADERAARHLANVDALTGLLNRRALLEQVVAWCSPEPIRLLLVDIDHFKAINDAHGHLIGDEVLRGVAEVLAIRADLNASVARMGGEEFALIGSAADLPEGVALGIIADIRGRPMTGDVRITVSVGMAEGMVESEDDWRELYRRADAALYQAKAEGRNRAIHAAPGHAAHRNTAAA